MTAALAIFFCGIYLVGDHGKQLPDGLSAIESNISEVRIYVKGDSRVIPTESDIYNRFAAQLSNCAGHLLEVNSIFGGEVINDSERFIEVIFNAPQTISFSNANGFVISGADRILYNADKNMMYWGKSDYQFCVDYMKLDSELMKHEADILAQYQILLEMIAQYFEQFRIGG